MYCCSPLCQKGPKGSTEHLGPLRALGGSWTGTYSVSLHQSSVSQWKQITCTSVRSYGTNSVRSGQHVLRQKWYTAGLPYTAPFSTYSQSYIVFKWMHHTKQQSKCDCYWQEKHVAGMSEIKRCTAGGFPSSGIWYTTTCYRNVGNQLPSDACQNKWKPQVYCSENIKPRRYILVPTEHVFKNTCALWTRV